MINETTALNREIELLENKKAFAVSNMNLPDLELNVSGQIISTHMSLFQKVPGNRLLKLLTGEIPHQKSKDRILIFSNAAAFKGVVKYLERDRTWLPEDHSQLRAAVEQEIKRWGLDKGLARVDTLLTKVAREFQAVMCTIPNVDGPGRFKKHGFVTISWIAAMSGKTIDLRDGEHIIMRQTKNGAKPLNVDSYLKNSSNTKDEIFIPIKMGKQELYLQRKVWKNGTVREGIFSEDDKGYGRLLLNSSRVRIGNLMGRNLQGLGAEFFPNDDQLKGEFNKGKLINKLPDLVV